MSSLVDWGWRGLLAWNYGERWNYGGTKVKKRTSKKLGGYTFIWFFFFLKTYVTIMEQLHSANKIHES